jgi:cell division ATPase FtsA
MADEERIIVVEGCVEFSEKRLITARDVDSAIEATRSVPLPPMCELMDVRVLYFTVDGERTRDPEGMEGKRLVMVAEMITETPETPDCAFRG